MEGNPENNPGKKLFLDLFRQEKASLGAFETRKRALSPEEITQEGQHLWARIRQDHPVPGHAPHRLLNPRIFFAVAATVALCIIAYVAYVLIGWVPATTYSQTTYGETASITLPDSSRVVLNANSRLTYPENWDHQSVREVWLEGEAFFQVRKKSRPGGVRFIVHVQGMDVEVLGTRFNVRERRGATEVVLNAGKVKLNLRGTKEILMEPGDLVEYSSRNNRLARKKVNPETYTAWRNHVLMFEDSSLGEIAAVLEDTYGFDISFQDPEIAKKRFTTTLSSDKVNILFPMLEESFNLIIIQHGKQITIENSP